jgi:hypothetical protein
MVWKKAFALGDFSPKTTPHPHAAALGDTSIADMEAYYKKFFRKNPPTYA